MWIKQIILDGFKSYAHRTVVGPFDREFNAITGLNGSGKSNILDAICFVFAISNLQNVRVKDLTELIYKGGQAGISKASVTIDFDNTDPDGKPPMFRDADMITITRQIVVGGRYKFFINGSSAQLSQVQNLFHSVQLNVNNPHFLIMQGTITKVLNMKPQDRLAMLEEAAGTRMFETKKNSAQMMVKRKDVKLSEIDRQLEEEMKPTLQRRENDRREYDAYLQGKNQIEMLARMKQAYDYEMLKENVVKLADEVKAAETAATNGAQEVTDIAVTVTELEAEIGALKEKFNQSLATGLNQAEGLFDEEKKKLVASETEKRNLVVEIAKQKKAIQKAQQEEERTAFTMKKHADSVAKARADLEKFEEEFAELETTAGNLDKQLELMKSGIAASSEGLSLTEQLNKYKKELIQVNGQAKQGELSIAKNTQALENVRSQAKSSDKEYNELKKQLQEAEAILAEATASLEKQTGFDPAKLTELQDLVKKRQPKIQQVEHDVRRLETVIRTRLDVQYSRGRMPPELHGKVKGMVAKLFKVTDPKYNTAITQAAGRALYNVVVDTEHTAKQLLKEVKSRVTIIPLNNVQDQVCPSKMCLRASDLAKKTGPDAESHLALDLVEFDEEVQAAMRFVFGRKFICNTLDAASAVTFAKDIRQVSVTYDGEVVQPGGVMQGGATKDLDKILETYYEYLDTAKNLERMKNEQVQAEREISLLIAAKRSYEDKQADIKHQQGRVNTLGYKMQTNQQHQITEQIAKYETALEEAQQRVTEAQQRAATLTGEIAKLEKDVKGGTDLTKGKKEVEGKIAAAKQKMKAMIPKREQTAQMVADADATREEMDKDLEQARQDKAEEEKKLTEAEAILRKVEREISDRQELVQTKERQASEIKRRVNAANSGLAAKEKELATLRDREGDLKAKQEQLRIRVGDLQKVLGGKRHALSRLEESDFVVQNQANFGKTGNDLDWRSIDYVKEFSRLESLKAQHAKRSKNVNHKVVAMYESVEAQYKDVLSKRDEVQRDKAHVLTTIEELNVQKKKTVAETFAKVSVDFTSIFSSLLPGASAKLKPDYDEDEMITGLSICVAMGKSWKESLTELSGGQRSLLALSYILALLKYKPAPVYILDEVDAALDLSHTQNIGKMLSNHFKDSQFLVVSLKEGMFNNANVLFRVRLVDGQSQTTRHDNTKANQQGARKRGREDATDTNKQAKRQKALAAP